jgi:hypothetical protein
VVEVEEHRDDPKCRRAAEDRGEHYTERVTQGGTHLSAREIERAQSLWPTQGLI